MKRLFHKSLIEHISHDIVPEQALLISANNHQTNESLSPQKIIYRINELLKDRFKLIRLREYKMRLQESLDSQGTNRNPNRKDRKFKKAINTFHGRI